MQPRVVAERRTILGEGPLWDDRTGRLYWVDIRRSRLHWIAPSAGKGAEVRCSAQVSALGLRSVGGFIAAADRAVGTLDPESGHFEARITFELDKPRNRTNDGAVAGDGRFWFGTMDDGAERGQGALYSVGADWTLKQACAGVSIPNGIRTTPDGRRLYVADSLLGVIYAHAMDPVTGTLMQGEMFASVAEHGWSPDGAALDEDGCLWSAQWDGARVLRFTPDGEVDRMLELPVSRPTACAFGGGDMKTLYITSARDGLGDAGLAREPLAGALFAVDLDVRGASYPAFAG